jgi:hypothetical protein
MELSLDPNVLPPKSPGKGESGNADAYTEVHDVVDAVTIGLQYCSELITRDQFADGANPSADDGVRGDPDHGDALLQLLLQTVAEYGICGDQEHGAAHILAEDDDGHGNRDLRRGDEILDCDVALEYKDELS